MKQTSLWLIKLALAVQFACVLAVPSIVAASESPRSVIWMAEWIRPNVAERAIGILVLREGKLSFAEQVGPAQWEIDVAAVSRVEPVENNRLSIVTNDGATYVISVMDATLVPTSPKKMTEAIERAMQTATAGAR